jgi:polar amino acid transport system substrate-binding protein
MHRKLIITLLFCFSSLSMAAPVKMGAPFFPPYAYFDIDGNLTGIWYEQLAPVLARAEIDYKPVNVPIKRFYSAVATGKVQLSALPLNMPGMEDVLLSEKPFSKFDLRVFWLDGQQHIDSLSQLAGKKVLLIGGYSYGGLLRDALPEEQRDNFKTVANQAIALKAMLSKEADYVLGYWAMMSYLQKNYPQVQLNNHKVAEIPVHFAIHNSAGDAQDMMRRFEAALNANDVDK